MNVETTTRDRLVAEGMRQLMAYGYDGVGLGPLLKSVQVPKGSFYHFFRSKDDFVVAVIQAYDQKYCAIRQRIFDDETRGPLDRLQDYFQFLERELHAETPFAGCLYGVIAQTLAGREPQVRQALARSFHAWEESLAALLASAQRAGEIAPEADIPDLVASIVEAYEGALIRMKAADDPAVFARFRSRRLPELLGLAPD